MFMPFDFISIHFRQRKKSHSDRNDHQFDSIQGAKKKEKNQHLGDWIGYES